MFYYYQSHSLTELAEHFSKNFEANSINPLQPAWIIVQNNEIKEWLSLQFAGHNEIAGNFRFIFPSELLWVLYRIKHKDIPDVLPGDLNAMQWSLFELLSDEIEWLQKLTRFSIELNAHKTLFQFCGQLADIFDQYQVYRPEMMELWLEGKKVTGHKDEYWQAEIWRRLYQKWQNSDKVKDLPRRSEAHSELLQWINKGDDSFLNEIPKNIYIFGLSNVSSPFVDVISSLSSAKNIYYYLNEPDLSSGDSRWQNLVSRWSKPLQDQKVLLENALRLYEPEVKRQEITAGENNAIPSVKIHSCHNKRREVQVLKDKILHYLDNHPDTKPSDVLIMVPDPEAYSGVIDSVFSAIDQEPSLPFTELRQAFYESVEYAFSELLNLLSSSFKADLLLEFMHTEPVKERFGFTESDLEIIEEWIVSNKIHFGLGEDLNTAYSWRKGVNQLISGFTMEADELQVYNGLVPQNTITTTEEALLASRFSRFVHQLIWAGNEIKNAKTPLEWVRFAESLVQDFLTDESSNQTNQIHKKLTRLGQQIEFSQDKIPVDFELIKNWLNTLLSNQQSASGRFGRGITVSSYIPYRSVPFKFIAMLGMDEGTFPRKAIRSEFDLIYAKSEAGDRILKEDDSYLFLETLQACKDQLHFSYVGNDQRSDSKKLPSILLQQFKEVVETDSHSITIEHGLHPFNKQYFNSEGTNSYSKIHQQLAAKIFDNTGSGTPSFLNSKQQAFLLKTERSVTVRDIISFFTHPCKYFADNELDAKNYDNFNNIEGRELFDLKGLDRYKLDDLLYRYLSGGQNTDAIFEYAQANAMIPAFLQGEKSFRKEEEGIKKLIQSLDEVVTEEARKEEIRFHFNEFSIVGTIDGIYGDYLISYRVGKRRAKHEIEHWLKHLMLIQSGVEIHNSLFLSVDDNEVENLSLLTDKVPKDTLNTLLEWFLSDGPIKPRLAFFPESSRAYAEEFLKSNDRVRASDKANNKWEESNFNKYADSADFNNKLIWRDENPVDTEAFHENAIRFWEPFFNALGGKG